MNPATSSDMSEAHVAKLSSVLEDVIARRMAGEDVLDEAVIDRHRELMPQLGARLADLRRVEHARRRAVQSSETAYGTDALRLIRDRRPALLAPDVLPGYCIIRELHRGGQGVVYLAHQLSTRREVAIKVLREGPFAGPRELARFEREVQILAQLSHPHIVAIHDSGRAPDGHFYFVMDYIAGQPLDEFVGFAGGSQPRGPLDERLALFERICDAIHAAHLRGVIHRDLKPGNIRVDGRGEPHVLDFGLARMGDEDAAAGEVLTTTGQFIGSLPWASPEQAAGGGAALDVRADVYSLGVILYQMLLGRFPYSVTGPMQAVLASIQNAEPVRARTIDPRIDEDLETIVLKCLAKEPERRYQSAGELAREIARYRAGEPIEARRDSAAYLLRMALRRHRVAATVGLAFVLLIAGGAVSMAFLYRGQTRALATAELEADKSREILAFMQDMLGAADPHQARGRDVTVKEVLHAAAERIDPELHDRPEVAAAIHRTIGQTYMSLGQARESEEHYRAALELADSTHALGASHPDALAAMTGLATALEAQNEYDEAEALYRAVLAGVRSRAAQDRAPGEEIDALHNLGNFLRVAGRFAEAEPLLLEARAASQRELGAEHPDTLITRKVLASLWQAMGRPGEAEAELRDILAAQRRILGDDAPETVGTAQHLGMLLRNAGRFDEAEPLFREVLATSTRIHGERHPETLRSANSLARMLHARGRLDEAEALFRQTAAMQAEALGPEHADTLITRNNLSLLLKDAGRFDEAEAIARDVEAAGRRTLGDDHPDALVWANNLGNLLYRRGAYSEAEAIYRHAADGRRRALGESHPATLNAITNLGNTLARMGRLDEAEALLREVLELRRQARGESDADTMQALLNLAHVHARQGRSDEAEAEARRALEFFQSSLGGADVRTTEAMLRLGQILAGQNRHEEAVEQLEAALALAEAAEPPPALVHAMIRAALCESLSGLGRTAEAEAHWTAACEELSRVLGEYHPDTRACREGYANQRPTP